MLWYSQYVVVYQLTSYVCLGSPFEAFVCNERKATQILDPSIGNLTLLPPIHSQLQGKTTAMVT